MMYLPKKLDMFLREKAQSMNLDFGEYLFFIIRRSALDQGFDCSHPIPSQVLYKKGFPSQGISPLWRCRDCGFLYYKLKDSSIKPRVEAIE